MKKPGPIRITKSILRHSIILPVLVATGCGGGSGSDDEMASFDCSQVSLKTLDTMPLQTVGLNGITPEDAPTIILTELASGDSIETFSTIRDGGVEFAVPFLLESPTATGAWGVRVDVDSESCSIGDLSVNPLPASPGTLERFVTDTKESIDLMSIAVGSTTSALLAASLDDLDNAQLLQRMVIEAIVDPTNPNRLDALIDGSAPILDGVVDYDIAESAIASLPVLELLQNSISALEEAGPPLRMASGYRSETDGMKTAGNLVKGISADTVIDADSLSRAMLLSSRLKGQDSGATSKVRTDVSNAAAVAGLAPHPAIKVLSYVIGLTAWIDSKYNEIVSASLPSSFVSATLDSYTASIAEDDPNDGSWDGLKVVSTSVGANITKAFIEGLIQAGGLFFTAQSVKQADGVYKWAGVKLVDLTNDLAELTILNTTNAAVGVLPNEVWPIEPFIFPAIDISSETWSEMAVAPTGGALERVSHRFYKPARIGTAGMVVSARPEKFGGATIDVSNEVEVKAMQITITPPATNVDPGDEVTFEVALENAYNFGISWSVTGGSLVTEDLGLGRHRGVLTTPASEGEFPIGVTVTSTSNTGLRAIAGAAPVTAQAIVRTGEAVVLVIPGSGCAETGETIQFSAEVLGAGQSVSWSAQLGSIDSSGRYTAPGNLGAVDIVTATSIDEPTAFGSAQIDVSGCECKWQLSYSGGSSGLLQGDVAFAPDPNIFESITLSLGVDDEGSLSFPVTGFVPTISSGDTGLFNSDMTVITQPGLIGGRYENDATEGFNATIQIDQFTDTFIAGRIGGTLVETNHMAGTDPGSISIIGSFVARYDLLSGRTACPE